MNYALTKHVEKQIEKRFRIHGRQMIVRLIETIESNGYWQREKPGRLENMYKPRTRYLICKNCVLVERDNLYITFFDLDNVQFQIQKRKRQNLQCLQ